MINLKLRSEYSFQKCFGPIPRLIEAVGGAPALGLCDIHSTFGHVQFHTACRKAGKKPLLGLQVNVVRSLDKERKQQSWVMTLLAKNLEGLKEIYHLNSLAFEQMYYVPRLQLSQINNLSSNIILLSGSNPPETSPEATVYQELNPAYGQHNKTIVHKASGSLVATSDMYFPLISDRSAYELIADRPERKTTPQYILPGWEIEEFGWPIEAIQNTYAIADLIEDFDLPQGLMPDFPDSAPLLDMCRKGIAKRNMPWSEEYEARMHRELDLIALKKFENYFYMVADMVQWAKGQMLVGPARGSAAGSLVCYLLEITEVDPIPFGLLFERFIDITRKDLPDIDMDFPDSQREDVIEYLRQKYGEENVAHIGTVSRYKAKSSIGEAAKKYNIPYADTVDIKGAIIERSGGDARTAFCIKDTFETLEVGQKFLQKYPAMINVAQIENHARHSGCHAAGILVCSHSIKDCCTVAKDGVAQIDKYDAEKLNMLKMDILGLRTLTVLGSCMSYLGLHPSQLYSIPLEDQAAFDVINKCRFSGVFQFEGFALQSLAKQMGIKDFNDIVAITSLARPGPLHSGGATNFVDVRIGNKELTYDHPALEPYLKETFGTTVYQEQVMQIARGVGGLSWEDVTQLRKAMSKSLGEEFFNQYWEKFKVGAGEHGMSPEDAEKCWKNMCTFGCLSGKTLIDLPASNQHSPEQIILEELYQNGGVAKVATEKGNTYAQRGRFAKIWCNIGGAFKPERLLEVYQSGIKETWLVKLKSGHSIRATKDHQFYTQQKGWQKLSELHPGSVLSVLGGKFPPKKDKGTGSGAHNIRPGQSKLFSERQKQLKATVPYCLRCKEAPNEETHHKDGNRLNNEFDNLIPVCGKCHKQLHAIMGDHPPAPFQKGRQLGWSEVVSISEPISEMTYDIAMPTPHNNFVANGISVRNSWAFNKSHAVSYAMLSYFCMWLKAHHPLEFALACLNNEKDQDSTIKLLRELVNEGFEYKAWDPTLSELGWSIKDGKLVGGFTAIKGIGSKTAEDIIKRRSIGQDFTPGQKKAFFLAKLPGMMYSKLGLASEIITATPRDTISSQVLSIT